MPRGAVHPITPGLDGCTGTMTAFGRSADIPVRFVLSSHVKFQPRHYPRAWPGGDFAPYWRHGRLSAETRSGRSPADQPGHRARPRRQRGRDLGRRRAAADALSQRPGDRHHDDDRRLSRLSGGRLSAEPEHAARRRQDHRDRPRRRDRHRRRAHQAQDRLREEAQEEDADLGLRPGHRVRRRHGALRGDRVRPERHRAHIVDLRSREADQHHREPLPRGRRDPRLRLVRGGPAADLHGGRRPPQTRSTRSPATCSSRGYRPRASCSTRPAG